MLNIFIGYDPRESIAFSVLAHSIVQRSAVPVAVTPLALRNLGHLMTRPRDPLQSTDFSFSRFLVPYLSGYSGWSLYMDCDMLVMDDINRLFELRDQSKALMVVQHDYEPSEDYKFLNQAQSKYRRKNWSSLMLFNNELCSALTPEYVNSASGLDLHQFGWLPDDALIGKVPARWNHLVGYGFATTDVAVAHYTKGGPYFKDYADCDFAREWWQEFRQMAQAIDSSLVVPVGAR
jgi:hypothetical protein